MPQITVDNTNALKRYEFIGDTLPQDWGIVAQGAGQTVTIANSMLSIAAGLEIGAQTVIRCSQKIRIKTYVRFIARLSQRIANQSFILELSNAAGTTFARYDLNGTSATTAQCQTGNNGSTNALTNATVATTANFVTLDLYADTNDVVFSSVASNSNAAKAGVVSFDRFIPDPDEDYFVQIRVVNGATAPASNTTLDVDCVVIQDLTGVKVDIIRGDGTAALANMAPVNVLACAAHPVTQSGTWNVGQTGTWTVQPGNTVNTTPWLVTNRGNLFFNDSTTNLAANATFTGTSRDVTIAASTLQPYGNFNAIAVANQAGTVRIEMSNDNSVWRRATPDTAVAANTPVILSIPVCTRYHRVVYVNGATAQTEFMINTSYTAA